MIIHQPEITTKDGKLKISAQIETTNQRGELPETLWFAFPESYAGYVTDRSDGFLSALFVIAMYLGEDIEVRGTVSPQLANNVAEMIPLYRYLDPKILQLISIQYKRLQALPPSELAHGVGISFSGGVDSFYALWQHLPENQPIPETRITHGLFIQGFDIFLKDQPLYEQLYDQYAQIFSRLDLDLLHVETNARMFYRNRVDWDLGHNGPLFGTVQVLGRLFSRYYKPSSDELVTGRMFLGLYSTETLDVSIHAATLGRLEKLEMMKDWPMPRGYLRVCMRDEKTADGRACYRCSKCLNTLVYLDLLGIRKEFPNFPKPLTWVRFAHLCWINFSNAYYVSFLPRYLIRERRFGLLFIFWLLYFPVEIQRWLKRRILHSLPKAWIYTLKKRVFGAQPSG